MDFDGPNELSAEERAFMAKAAELAVSNDGPGGGSHKCLHCGYDLFIWVGDMPNQKVQRFEMIEGHNIPSELTYDCPKCDQPLRESGGLIFLASE